MTNLVITPDHLGDAILRATPFMSMLKHEPFVVIAAPHIAPLFEDCPNLEKLIIRNKKPWRKHLIDEWQMTKGKPWGTILDFKNSLFPYFLQSDRMFVWNRDSSQRRLPWSKFSADASRHVVLQVGHAFGAADPLDPVIWLSKDRLARNKPARPTLAISPTAGWAGKQWPFEDFATLLTQFCKTYPDAQVAIFAAPHERARIKSLLEALPQNQYVDMIGSHLLDSAALIQWSQVFIGNDSGLMHLSAAVGTPTIALFGPSDERTHGPWSSETPSPHRTIRGSAFTGHIRQTARDAKCYMTDIPVSHVWETLQERWETVTKHQPRRILA